MGLCNKKTTGWVRYPIQAVTILICFCTLTNAQESTATNGSNISRNEDKFHEYDSEEYQKVQLNEQPYSPDFLEQISNELPSAAKQAYQDEMEKQTKCQRMEGDGSFYDPSTSSCKACKDYCSNSDYCGIQCEAYFVKIEAKAEHNRLLQELEANKQLQMWIIGLGIFMAIVVFVFAGFLVCFFCKLKRLEMNNDKRWHKSPTAVSMSKSNTDHDEDGPMNSTSTIAESIHSIESETTKLCKNSSQEQSHEFDGNNTNAA